jgi:hypothetical protein
MMSTNETCGEQVNNFINEVALIGTVAPQLFYKRYTSFG